MPQSPQPSAAPSEPERVTYRELIYFFLPLGITPAMFATTHSIVLGALARLPSPAANIAVYTVVQALANAVKAPCLASRQTTSALIHGTESYRAVMRYIWAICAVFIVCLGVIGFTPAGEWVLRTIIGLTDDSHIALAYTGLRIAVLLPLVETLRNSLQGLAISLKATKMIPASTATRVIVITLFAAWAVSAQKMSGIVVGTVAWTMGIGIEGVLVALYLVFRFGSPMRAAGHLPRKEGAPMTPSAFFKFFIPLGVMMTVTAWMPPVLQSGLARGPSPTETLAAFGVAWSLTTILTGPLQMLHHAPLVYVSQINDPLMPKVRRFCLGVGLVVCLAMLGVAWTPLGPWLVGSVLSIPPDIVPAALNTLAALSFFPLIASWRESYWGVLMRQRRTSIIGVARLANLILVFVVVLLAFGPLKGVLVLHPAVVGALIFTLGEAMEAIAVWRQAIQQPGISSPGRLLAQHSPAKRGRDKSGPPPSAQGAARHRR